MFKQCFAFLGREIAIILVLLVAFVPAMFLGGLADCAGIVLHLAHQTSPDAFPSFSAWVAKTFGGHQGYWMVVACACWLATWVWFVAAACTTRTRDAFRLRFLPGFLLIWSVFLGLTIMVLFAWAIPHTPLFARLETPWYVGMMPILLGLELVLIVAIPVYFAVRRAEHANDENT